MGHRRLVDGRDVRAGPHRHASGVVQLICRHRRQHGPRGRNQGANHRAAVRRQRRRLGRLRPGHRHRQTRPIHRGLGLVRCVVEQPAEASSRSVGDGRQRRLPRRPGADRQPQRPDLGGRVVVRTRPRQRHQLRDRRSARQARLAVCEQCFRRGTALAGRSAGHSRGAEDSGTGHLATRLGSGSARRASRSADHG